MVDNPDADESLIFTVATVWKEERVSCPHPDILAAYGTGALEGGAMDFIRFHLQESQCPFCNAIVEDQAISEVEAARTGLQDLRDKLMRSTTAALRRVSRA